MLDPTTTTRTDPLRNERWGYTGEMLEDPVYTEDSSSGPGRWLLWIALVAIAVIVVVALMGATV